MAFLLSDRINKMNKIRSEKNGRADSVDSVHSVEKQSSDRIKKINKRGSENPAIASSINPENSVHSVEKPLPNSKKIYVSGKLHPDIRDPFVELPLAPQKPMNVQI